MKKSVILILLLFHTALLWSASNYQIFDLHFLPAEYYVGDVVEMSFTIKTDQRENYTIPETFPEPVWLNILSMNIDNQGQTADVTIRLIPYYPGTRALPALNLGSLVLDDLKIFTSSLLSLEASRELEGVQAPLLIPGTRAAGAVIVSLLLALPVIFVILFRFIRKKTVHIIKTYKINLPYRQFQRLVRKIRRSMVNMPEKEFYHMFTGGLKTYLSTRFHHDFSSSTTSEIEDLLGRSRIYDSLALSLINLFHRVDRVKFAGDKLLYSDREQLLSEVEDVSEALEQWRKKHADI